MALDSRHLSSCPWPWPRMSCPTLGLRGQVLGLRGKALGLDLFSPVCHRFMLNGLVLSMQVDMVMSTTDLYKLVLTYLPVEALMAL